MQEQSNRFTRALAGTAVCVIFCVAGYVWIRSATNVRHLADNLVAAYLISWGLYAVLLNIPRVEFVKRFILLTSTVACILLLLEAPVWMGLVDYRRIFSITSGFETWDKPGFVADDELLWIHSPYLRMKGTYTRGDVGKALCFPHSAPRPYDSKYDRNGFRNEADLDAADTAVIGDSYVEAAMSPSSEVLTSVLGRLGNSVVANLGVVGYGPQQELAVLKRHALTLHPKTIVWFFYEGNDLEDAREYDKRAGRLPKNRDAVQTRLQRSFVRNALWAFLHTSRECIPSHDLVQRYGIVRDETGATSRIYFAHPVLPLSQGDIDALEIWKAALTEGYRLCRQHGVRLVVVFGPSQYRVYQGLQNLTEVSDEVKTWVINDLPERLRSLVADIAPDIHYVDLTPVFKSQVTGGIPVYLPDDTHWSAEGHKVVAQTLHMRLHSPIAIAQ